MISRRQFLQFAAAATVQRGGTPRGSEFVFARLRYESGDWDYNPLAKLPASHPIYRSFFTFTGGPPQTSHELNGWGNRVVG